MDSFLFPLFQVQTSNYCQEINNPCFGCRKTDEAPPSRRFMAEHEVVIEWQGAESQRGSIIALVKSLEGVEHEETVDGLKFVFRAMELNDLRMMVDRFLEECAKIEQG